MHSIGAKIGVKELLHTHVGRIYEDGRVFHHHWKNGSEIVSLAEFSNGREIILLENGVDEPSLFYSRVHHVLSERKPYNLLTNNCEHIASYVSNGMRSSPQLAFYSSMGLIALGTYTLMRTSKT